MKEKFKSTWDLCSENLSLRPKNVLGIQDIARTKGYRECVADDYPPGDYPTNTIPNRVETIVLLGDVRLQTLQHFALIVGTVRKNDNVKTLL